MLLSVRQDFPQPGEELDPRLLSQRGGDVAELDEGAQQGSRLQEERPVWRPALATQDPTLPDAAHCLTLRTSTDVVPKADTSSGHHRPRLPC